VIALALWGAAHAAAPDAEIEVVAPAEPGPAEVLVDEVARPGDGLEDVLATVPGVRVRRLGGLGAFAGISLRGTGFRQTLVRLDGVPLNPDGVAAVDLARFPLAGLHRVRVISGRPPATVGAAPIGGVVELETTDTPQSRLEGAVGSFGSVRASAAVARAGPVVDGLIAADGLRTAGTFDYLDDGGTRFVTDDDRFVVRRDNDRGQASAIGRLRIREHGRQWTLLGTGALRDEGLPGPIGLPQSGVRLATGRGLAALEVRRTTTRADGRLRAWFLGRRERLSDPDGALGRVDEVQRDRFDTVGLQGEGQWAEERVSLRGSFAVRHEAFARRPDGTSARRAGAALALDVPVRWPALTVTPGLDVRGLVTLGADARVGAALPGVSAVLLGDRPVSAWASATMGFRPPDLTELYGDRGTLVGNPDLRPERARKVELGARARGGGAWTVAVDGALSATWTTDQIGWLQNTQRTLVAVNFGETRTLGAEVGARLALDDRLGLDASLTALSATQTTDDPTRRGRPVPFVAPLRAWSRATVRPVAPLALGLELDHTASVPVDPQGVTIQPRRTLLGASVAVAWRFAELTVRVDNLLDTRTGLVPRDPLGADDAQIPAPVTDFVGYPLPGRTLWVALRLEADRP